jgi:hypothetical protein
MQSSLVDVYQCSGGIDRPRWGCRMVKQMSTYFISVCSILLRINTNIIINECPLSQHCFNII